MRVGRRFSFFRSFIASLAFVKARITQKNNRNITGWLQRLRNRGSDERSSKMSEKILRQLKSLEDRLGVIEGRLANSTNVNARIRDRIKTIGDRIKKIETEMGVT